MKHYSDDSKKLIKNVVSLVVSALLLAAATMAWFASNSSASVSGISAMISSSEDITYARMAPDNSFLDFDVTDKDQEDQTATDESELTSTLAIRSAARPSVYTDVDSYLVAKTGASDWKSSGSDEIADENTQKYHYDLIPGNYQAYRISYSGNGTARDLAFQSPSVTVDGSQLNTLTIPQIQALGITLEDENATVDAYRAALERKVLESIYVYAFVRTVTPAAQEGGEDQVLQGSAVTKTLYALAHPETNQPGLSNIVRCNAAVNSSAEIYYVIGIPANAPTSDLTLHDWLRQVGAAATISNVNLVDVSAG